MSETQHRRFACNGCPAVSDVEYKWRGSLPDGWVRIEAYEGDAEGIGQDVDLVDGLSGGPDLHYCSECQNAALMALTAWRRP